jgi:hypothetical protein
MAILLLRVAEVVRLLELRDRDAVDDLVRAGTLAPPCAFTRRGVPLFAPDAVRRAASHAERAEPR